ncbi:MAG: hypothetical protein EOM17_16735 [Synergistales bacterium]|nr:hypothetical protein [Synergistales bacterium]
MRWKIWIQAFRPKTLPLALSCTVTGTFLALSYGHFRWPVFLLTLLTTLSLQILSNLANDYGDAKTGADNLSRVGPQRVTATGRISPHAIKRMILFFVYHRLGLIRQTEPMSSEGTAAPPPEVSRLLRSVVFRSPLQLSALSQFAVLVQFCFGF